MRSPNRRATVALVASLVAALAAVAVFLTWGVDGHWDFALPRRAEQVAALAVVGAAVAAATVVFQTLTQNRILTPAIMGFDALYIALATGLVFVLGFRVVDDWPPFAFFSLSAGAMMIAATALYRWVLGDGTRGLYVLVLVGVIMGTFFGSVTSFMFRTMDPNEFDGLMSYLFASVGSVDGEVLTLAATVLGTLCRSAKSFALSPLRRITATNLEFSAFCKAGPLFTSHTSPTPIMPHRTSFNNFMFFAFSQKYTKV